MVSDKTRSIAVAEFQDESGITALLIHQIDPDTFYAVFDDGRLTHGFDTLDELKKFLMKIGFQEI